MPRAYRNLSGDSLRKIFVLGTVLVLALSITCCTGPAGAARFSKAISFSILEDYDKGDDLESVEADFKLFQELGICTWRGSFGWDDYEPARGDYDFDWLHRFAESAERHHIRLRPYIGYTPEWAAAEKKNGGGLWNRPPTRIEDWYTFVFKLASAMKRHRNVLSFEIYNEANSRLWWDGSAEEYNRILKYGSDAIRKSGGDYQIFFGGMVYPDVEWVAKACVTFGNGGAFDILPFHAYPETWTNKNIVLENYLDQGKAGYFHTVFIPSADQRCGRKAIWINELGFAATPGKRTERDQANWWVRAIATFVAEPRIEHLGIYEIKDPKPDAAVIGEPENHHLGLTYSDRRKKLAFHTVKRLIRLLDTRMITVADRDLKVDVVKGKKQELYHHLFLRPDGIQVVFVWEKIGSPSLRLELPNKGTEAIEYGLDGSGKKYRSFDGKIIRDVKLSPGEVRIFEVKP